jgi:hypothetical protein
LNVLPILEKLLVSRIEVSSSLVFLASSPSSNVGEPAFVRLAGVGVSTPKLCVFDHALLETEEIARRVGFKGVGIQQPAQVIKIRLVGNGFLCGDLRPFGFEFGDVHSDAVNSGSFSQPSMKTFYAKPI